MESLRDEAKDDDWGGIEATIVLEDALEPDFCRGKRSANARGRTGSCGSIGPAGKGMTDQPELAPLAHGVD
jgi:hypothetical protein